MDSKRKAIKRVVAWIICLAMVVTIINLPIFGAEVNAAANFSLYLYDNSKSAYVDGEATAELSVVLSKLGISGEISSAISSNSEYFSAEEIDGVWYITAIKGFSSSESLTVTVDGTEYILKAFGLPNSIDVVLKDTIYFDPNGGSGALNITNIKGPNTNGYYYYNIPIKSVYILPECTFTAPEGKKFRCWEISGVEYAEGEAYLFGEYALVKAIWEDDVEEEADPVARFVDEEGEETIFAESSDLYNYSIAKSGTLYIEKDIDLANTRIAIEKTHTVKILGKHKITSNYFMTINNYGNLYISETTVENTGTNTSCSAIRNNPGGSIYLSDDAEIIGANCGIDNYTGLLSMTGGSITGEIKAIDVPGSNNKRIEISGGVVSSNGKALDITTTNTTVSLSGGTYNGTIELYGRGLLFTDLLAEDYCFYENGMIKNFGKEYTYTGTLVVEAAPLARFVDEEGEMTIFNESADLYNYNIAKSGTLYIAQDIDLHNSRIAIEKTHTVKIYGKHKITSNYFMTINNYGNLYISETTVENTGTNTSCSAIRNNPGGSIYLSDDAEIIGANCGIDNYTGLLSMTGGSITGEIKAIDVPGPNNKRIEISGGVVSSNGMALDITTTNTTVSLSGGTFIGTIDSHTKAILLADMLADGYCFYENGTVKEFTNEFCYTGTLVVDKVPVKLEEKLAGYTISLKENIGVNLYMSLSEEIVNDSEAKLVITLPNGTENEILVSKATKSGTGSSALYIFSSGISAKEMTADIKAQIVLSDGRVGDEYTVTIQDYAKFIIDNSVVGAANYNASYEKSAPLVKSMMNYGAAAQIYFEFMTDKLANSILDDEDKVIPTEIEGLEDYNYTYPTASETTSFAGSSLILKDAVRMKFVVKSTETLTKDNVTVTIDGTPISSSRILIETDGANQNITVTNLKPNEYGKSMSVTAAGLTLENASVYGYIFKSQASSKTAEAMKNLGRALYFYGVESAKYSK